MHPWVRTISETTLISETSKQQYLRSLETLAKLADGRDLDVIVRSPKAMLRRIGKEYDNLQTRKALVNAVKALFKHIPGLKEKYEEEFEVWHLASSALEKAITDKIASAEPSEREKEKWVPWPEIVAKERELNAQARGTLEHLVLAMYVLMEPGRADYGDVQLVQNEPPNPKEGNYLILSSHTLVLNNYKTANKYGQYRRQVPPEVMDILRVSLSRKPREYLFTNESNLPYRNPNSYTKFVNRTLNKLFGKPLTISMLRHSFISNIDFNKSTPAELMDISKHMMHSVAMQQLYRRHIDPDDLPPRPQPALHIPSKPQLNIESKTSKTPKTQNGRFIYV